MRLFLDTNVILYANVEDPRYTAPCQAILEAVVEGRIEATTSAAVIEELLHLELRGRPAGLEGLARDAHELLGPVLPVTDEVIARALAMRPSPMGAKDRVHVATCQVNGLTALASADAHFDGVDGLARVDPGDPGQVAALVGPAPDPA